VLRSTRISLLNNFSIRFAHRLSTNLKHDNSAKQTQMISWESCYCVFFFFLWRCDPTRVMASSFLRFLDYTQRRTTVGRTPLDEWSAHRRDLYLTTHNTHNRQTSMPPVGFEPTISAGERPQTYVLDRAATGNGRYCTITNPKWFSNGLSDRIWLSD